MHITCPFRIKPAAGGLHNIFRGNRVLTEPLFAEYSLDRGQGRGRETKEGCHGRGQGAAEGGGCSSGRNAKRGRSWIQMSMQRGLDRCQHCTRGFYDMETWEHKRRQLGTSERRTNGTICINYDTYRGSGELIFVFRSVAQRGHVPNVRVLLFSFKTLYDSCNEEAWLMKGREILLWQLLSSGAPTGLPQHLEKTHSELERLENLG